MLLLAFPVSHYSEESRGLQIRESKEVRVKATAKEGLTGPELTSNRDSFSFNGNYTPSLLRSRTDSV